MKPRLVLTGENYMLGGHDGLRWQPWDPTQCVLVINARAYEYRVQYQTPERKELS
jgi:hypothetical protein